MSLTLNGIDFRIFWTTDNFAENSFFGRNSSWEQSVPRLNLDLKRAATKKTTNVSFNSFFELCLQRVEKIQLYLKILLAG
jgi:hypothetical protein